MKWRSKKIKKEISRRREEDDALDSKFGFHRYDSGPPRVGWMFNMLATTLPNEEGQERSGIDLYFLEEDGGSFKATVLYEPYFFVGVGNESNLNEASHLLKRKYGEKGMTLSVVDKEDLDMPNHLSGRLRRYLKLSFKSTQSLNEVKQELMPIIKANANRAARKNDGNIDDFMTVLEEIREYDVPHYIRCSIDLELRVGVWYEVTPEAGMVKVNELKEKLVKAETRVLAFDIECTKAPLKFPTAESDEVFMVSYMCDGQGYLIISREFVGEDIETFEYTPKPAFKGPFSIFNEVNEENLLRRFFSHVRELRPHVFVTYNGDCFDWPFIDARAKKYGMVLEKEVGVSEQNGEYRGRCSVHLDAFYWVKRDSYLPQGSHGLKAVTRYKLGYDPVEVDPEDMVRLAGERPTEMASYSVSDAVATYYLYNVYVHLFIFSLCTVIPMGPEDVLRKGSGTLCEALLMVEAYRGQIICPNKQVDPLVQFHGNHLLESETYVGGHVECLETGVFRSDLPQKFHLNSDALKILIDNIDRDLAFSIEVENGIDRSDVENYDAVRCEIIEALEMLRDIPIREEEPMIYHLDVAAMYPNIILSNRLQPAAIVDKATCAACDFNTADSNCKREMKWAWRGDMVNATRGDYEVIKNKISREIVDGKPFDQLSELDQASMIQKRVKEYARKVHRKVKVTGEEERVNTVCMRENDFYVSTVRAFRDRRYEYKILTKKWKKESEDKKDDAVLCKVAKDKEQVYDSLQLAHKCILNSFYGYVMRKGARWRSMEMAGIVTYTGAALITQARILVEKVGRPLELDTDGIWCILPKSFPQNFTFQLNNGSKIGISYPCVMLNADIHETYTNKQYQELVDPATRKYDIRSECSIFFEVDGPYRCMVIPSSTEEGKLLKKRYAVFNPNGTLAELKGFELKRRGELEIVKAFQSQVFEKFLEGENIQECYEAVSEIATYWLDVLDSEGENIADDELLELISENKTISRELGDYGDQKGTSLTTARRLADFLGAEMIKDRGLNCRLIIASKPHGAPVTDRAIPTAIFSSEPAVMKHFLRKWLKDSSMECFDLRSILDWGYYRERLAKTIQKIITIPAALQGIPNPIPRLPHPDWLARVVREKGNTYKQRSIKSMFLSASSNPPALLQSGANDGGALGDIEDTVKGQVRGGVTPLPIVHRRVKGQTSVQISPSTPSLTPSPTPVSQMEGPKKCPDRAEDFAGWLVFQKEKWANLRKRKRDDDELWPKNSIKHFRDDNLIKNTGISKGVSGYMKSARDILLSSTWQIIEIREGNFPGELYVWALIGRSDLRKIPISVPREFYVNIIEERKKHILGGNLVSRQLPHARPSPFLIKVTMSEQRYQQNTREVSEILRDSAVEGVYELETPIMFKAIMSLGCIARVKRKLDTAQQSEKFSIKNMELVPAGASQPYLSTSSGLRTAYFFHSRAGKKGIVGIFLPRSGDEIQEFGCSEGPISAQASIWFVDPFKGGERMNMKRLFQSSGAPEGSVCSFKTAYMDSMEAAFSSANAALLLYGSQRLGPTVVLTQSPLPPTVLRRSVPTLNDFPTISLPSNVDDSSYPAVGWLAFSGQRMLQRFLQSKPWLAERIGNARYSQIPISNLGCDVSCTIADVLFSRLLQHNRYVLWASEATKPDLGGINGSEAEVWAENLPSPIISNPGAYRNVCVKLDVFGLGVNSVAEVGELEDLEAMLGASNSSELFGDDSAGNVVGSDNDAVAGAFKILKILVNQWLADSDLKTADKLLINFYRWICSRQSLMQDPLLHRLVHRLMTKVFARYIDELQRLGATIVFANFYRIIIATNKTDVESAKEYVRFIVETLVSRKIFGKLQLKAPQFIEQFLFLDEENYGGISINDDSETSDVIEPELPNTDNLSDSDESIQVIRPKGRYDVEIESDNDSQSEIAESVANFQEDSKCILANWNISEQLSPRGKYWFLILISEFIHQPRKKALSTRQKHEQTLESLGALHATPNKQTPDKTIEVSERLRQVAEEEKEDMNLYMKDLVKSCLTRQVLSVLPIIIESSQLIDESNNDDTSKDERVGTPALEFVKALCLILQLDPIVSQEVQVLRKQALASLGVKEFSKESLHIKPASNMVLPDVICSHCQLCTDLDLCRDPGVISSDDSLRWSCRRCGCKHDVYAIEARLVEILERNFTTYQLADGRCATCKIVAIRSLETSCPCGGQLVSEAGFTREEQLSRLQLMRSIAQMHNFEWVLEVVENILLANRML